MFISIKYFLLIIFLFFISCQPEIEGCMDLSACNYNPQATVNIDTCIYPANAYDCDGNPLDFRAQYLGVWSFQVDWFMAGLNIGGSIEGSEYYIDSITATDVQNQLVIPYNQEGEGYYLFVDSFGILTGNVDPNNYEEEYFPDYVIEFEGSFLSFDSLYMYREWNTSGSLDGSCGYHEIIAKKISD
jgi:hypothetical protein